MAEPSRLERGNYRKQFADFLERLAAGIVDADEWSRFAITQYPDEFLEEIRRCTVRLQIGQLAHELTSAEGRQLLNAWAVAVRSSVHEAT